MAEQSRTSARNARNISSTKMEDKSKLTGRQIIGVIELVAIVALAGFIIYKAMSWLG